MCLRSHIKGLPSCTGLIVPVCDMVQNIQFHREGHSIPVGYTQEEELLLTFED